MADLPSNGTTNETSSRANAIPNWLKGSFGVVVAALATMWFVEALDTAILDDRLQGNGIHPRSLDGIDGVLWSPFLHSGFPHLISNSIPFVVLSGLMLTGGLKRYVRASAIIIVLGGLLVWALAIGSNENHIGASGWVFGMLGFLIAAAVFDKKALTIAVGLVALLFYGGTLLVGFVPTPGVSWEGHLFGFLAGIVGARVLSTKRSKVAIDPGGLG
ncbi:MAG: membrane associated rhomboid family serine protease [Verrucomicrobiales bacterium]|jgi:membrane associated rhomboid family serine protease